jgi:hypothetical protein
MQAEELRAKKLAKRAAWDAGFAQGGGAAAAAAAAAVDRGLDPAAAADGSDDEEGAEEDGAGGAYEFCAKNFLGVQGFQLYLPDRIVSMHCNEQQQLQQWFTGVRILLLLLLVLLLTATLKVRGILRTPCIHTMQATDKKHFF